MQEHGLFYCFKHRSTAKIMTVPCDYPFLAHFTGALILLYKLGTSPTPFQLVRHLQCQHSLHKARKVKR